MLKKEKKMITEKEVTKKLLKLAYDRPSWLADHDPIEMAYIRRKSIRMDDRI